MMNSREKVLDIFKHGNSGSLAMWTGGPQEKTVQIFAEKWGIEPTAEAVFTYLQDDCRFITADSGYQNSEMPNPLDPSYGINRDATLSAAGCFANTENIADIEKYPWPEVKNCDFSEIYKLIDQHQDKMIFTGMWSPFFHRVADFLGMENYFIKMYEEPAIIEAITEHVTDYYVQASEIFFTGLGDRADVMFFGNDFGTQLDLIISPESFRKFILPSLKRLIAVGKKYNKLIMLHSCGSIYRIIPDLINAGVDILHPLQAQAAGMSADNLKQYKNDLAFVGGIDAQTFFVNATSQQIRDEVFRVRDILGPGIVISPSHEAILPNVPAENVAAMAQAAREKR